MYYVVIMSYYNQPLPGRGKAKATKLKNGARQIQNGTSRWEISIPNEKMVQAIFLLGAWGKIPVFMGKNRPTPPGLLWLFHTQNNPPFARLKKFF